MENRHLERFSVARSNTSSCVGEAYSRRHPSSLSAVRTKGGTAGGES